MTESSERSSHKGKKRRSFTTQFKQEVVEFASEHSNRSAAQRFNVEPKRVREWKDNFDKIKTAKSSRQKLEGGGRKCIDEDLEENLVIWIYEQRSKILHVSRKMIMFKANKMFDEKNDDPATRD